jgi:hypothetical protein
MPAPIEGLRQTIRQLAPDGPRGFEGLLAAVLTEVTKRSFSLASAGSQQGKDGQSAFGGPTILFEAKRYDGPIPKDKLFTKVFEVAADRASIELYIVGATCAISAQHRSTLEAGTRKLSMALLIVAWPETGLPELAVLLAMARPVAIAFLAKHTSVSESELMAQFDAVIRHSQFAGISAELHSALMQPSIAPAFALPNNIEWLSKAFSSAKRARSVFGQALCPSDRSKISPIDRVELRTTLSERLFSMPDGFVIALLGADGTGKSWIFAQTWTHSPRRPLTVVIVPDDLDALPSRDACLALLIKKLLVQTDETSNAGAGERWAGHFRRWCQQPANAIPRLLVFMDGINQRESVDWLRFVDAMSELLAEIGGRLAFSCRRQFYEDRLHRRLISEVHEIEIPEWSDAELEQLLIERGSSMASLDASVVRSLRNPRIFGVAASLFKAHEITEFGELSVSRLLFEHIRTGAAGEGVSPTRKEFSADICRHAQDIVDRLRRQDPADLNAFDMPARHAHTNAIPERFIITAAGRFFEVLDENPDKYLLKEEGLPLALGLALVRTASEALRKHKSVEDALSTLLDPIAALDKTSDILMGALLAAVLQSLPAQIITPLVRSFVSLQNLDATRFPEFRSLFGRSPTSFLAALEQAVLTIDMTPNLSWLTDSVAALRDVEPFESAFVAAIHRWLSMYSLAPERQVLAPNNPQFAAEWKIKLAERKEKIETAFASLSATERTILQSMIREDGGNYSDLGRIAIHALARGPLAPFAESLRNWCFGSALSGGYHNCGADFDALLQFNLYDWRVTRDALVDAAEPLRDTNVSTTGKWALVTLLRATGDSAHAVEAQRIVGELSKDHGSSKGWRLIESYCATDPCDPGSERPDNIEETALKYQAIDPAELLRSSGRSQSDHFFMTGQVGLARFQPDAPVRMLRLLAEEAVRRPEQDFRTAAFALENHTIVLGDDVVEPFLQKANEIAQAALDLGEDKNGQSYVAAQFALRVAFPHMTGAAQLKALLVHPASPTISLDLGELFQPVNGDELERVLEQAVAQSNNIATFRVLSFADFSRSPLTMRTKHLILRLLTSTHHHVRLSALGLIRTSGDAMLLAGLVHSGWRADNLAPEHKVERYHGSGALVAAAQQGAISIEACLDRIDFSAYQLLLLRLGSEVGELIAKRVDTAIGKAVDFLVVPNLPTIVRNLEGAYPPVFFEVSEKAPARQDLSEQLRTFSESADAWYERQRQNEAAARAFERDLSKAGAMLIVEAMTFDLMEAIDEVAPHLVDAWSDLILAGNERLLENLRNIGLVAAVAIAKRNPIRAVALIERLSGMPSHVRVTFGDAGIDLAAVAAWQAAVGDEMKQLCFQRLDRACNDHELAMEVLAVIRGRKLDVLREYVLDRREREEPAHRARAVMVAGLSPSESWVIETVEGLQGETGFLLQAHAGATYAMKRHQWSLHWVEQMRNAKTPDDLWRYAVILAKIVDARLSWGDIVGAMPSALRDRFGNTLRGPVRGRYQGWKSKRESKLFGMSAPSEDLVIRQAVQ